MGEDEDRGEEKQGRRRRSSEDRSGNEKIRRRRESSTRPVSDYIIASNRVCANSSSPRRNTSTTPNFIQPATLETRHTPAQKQLAARKQQKYLQTSELLRRNDELCEQRRWAGRSTEKVTPEKLWERPAVC